MVGETVNVLVLASQVIKSGKTPTAKTAPLQAGEGVRLVDIVIYSVVTLFTPTVPVGVYTIVP